MNEAPSAFATDATEADALFGDAARAAGSTLRWIEHPLAGPSGEPLRVGVARRGAAEASKALVLLSATHGVEGFAGAAIQTDLLRDPAVLELDGDTAVLMVHLINPWGLAWSRREDHENIDLFRNFHYCDQPSEPDPLYDEIYAAMAEMAGWSGFDAARAETLNAQLVARHGLDRVVGAVRRGQHHQPLGMTYHGNGPSWSKQVLDDIVRVELAGCRHAAVLDIHTGFGAHGKGIITVYDAPDSERYRRIQHWFDDDIYTPGGDFDIPSHAISPYQWFEVLAPGCRVTAAILEFGTYPADPYRDAFLANHYHHVFGDPCSEEAQAVARRYREFCYPETDEWKRLVHARGRDAAAITLKGLHAWAASEPAA